MTIDEAIEREKLEAVSYCDLATTYHTYGNIYSRAEEAYRAKAEYHAQIAEWLSELKQLRKQEPILDKIRAEIKHFMYDVNPSSSESDYACNYILDILNKYKIESEDNDEQS